MQVERAGGLRYRRYRRVFFCGTVGASWVFLRHKLCGRVLAWWALNLWGMCFLCSCANLAPPHPWIPHLLLSRMLRRMLLAPPPPLISPCNPALDL